MSPEQAKSTHRRMIARRGETVTIRRYTGAGEGRPYFEADVRAAVLDFKADELVGGIVIGDRKLIVLAEDVIRAQLALPLRAGANEKVIVRGKPLTIKSVDDNKRRIRGVLVAYELVAGGRPS